MGKPSMPSWQTVPIAASQVAAINGAENVRSLRAAIATDESQMSKARLARKVAAFTRRLSC